MKSHKFFNYLLLILIFSSKLLIASLNCQRPEHEPFSDELPAATVLRGVAADVPTDGASAEEAVEALFRAKGWFVCPSKHSGDHGVDGLFTAKFKGHRIVVLCETKYRRGTTRLDLSKTKCVGCVRGGETKECYQMSRRWTYNALRGIVSGAEDYCATHRGPVARQCEVLCPAVREELLDGDNIFNAIRVAAVFSGTGNCRFHVLGATAAEGRDQRAIDFRRARAVWTSLGIEESEH